MREGGHAKKYQKYVEAERGYLVARGWSGSFDDGHAYRLVPYLQSIESSVGSGFRGLCGVRRAAGRLIKLIG